MTDFTGGTWRSLVDGSEVIAIPDRGLLHRFDATEDETVSTSAWDDLEDGADLSGTSQGRVEDVINGNAIDRYDGVDDVKDGSASSQSEPYHVFFVGQITDPSGFSHLFDCSDNTITATISITSDENYAVFDQDNNFEEGPSVDTNPHLWELIISGGQIELFEDESLIVDFDTANTRSLDGFTVGNHAEDGTNEAVDGGEILAYDPDDSGYDRNEVRSYLQDKWGV